MQPEPLRGKKKSIQDRKSSGNSIQSLSKPKLIGTGSSNNNKLSREELMKNTLEIEKERTIYEEAYRGGFDRIIPLPVSVGGEDSPEAESERELFIAMEATKSRLHKTTNAAAKRLEEIKRKREEREQKRREIKTNAPKTRHEGKYRSE